MTDPSELIRRASELAAQADHEKNIDTRERLLRMAQYLSISPRAKSGVTSAGHAGQIGKIKCQIELSLHCPENTVPKCRTDTVVSSREFMVVVVMFEQRRRHFARTMVSAVMHE